MLPTDAVALSRRLELHLTRNQFEACRNIIGSAEKDQEGMEGIVTAIAEIHEVDLIVVNVLDQRGLILISEIENLTVYELTKIPQIGPKRARAFWQQLNAAIQQNKRVQRRRDKAQ